LAHAAISGLDEAAALREILPTVRERLQLTPDVIAKLYEDLPLRSSSLIATVELY
jgi:hypothetical protein